MLLHALIVDDDPLSVCYIRAVLRKMGFGKVYSACNGKEALKFLGMHAIQLVLADWQMPQMTGLELLRDLRATEATSDLPFILITSEDRGVMVEVALAARPNAYIVKPYSIAKIQETVARVLNLTGHVS